MLEINLMFTYGVFGILVLVGIIIGYVIGLKKGEERERRRQAEKERYL